MFVSIYLLILDANYYELVLSLAEHGITPPESLNVSVGEYANFKCDFNFSLTYVAWYLDFTPVQYYTDLYVKENLCLDCQPITSSIRMFVSSEHAELLDNTSVRCQGINKKDSLFKFSLQAILRIQGEDCISITVKARLIHNAIKIRGSSKFTEVLCGSILVQRMHSSHNTSSILCLL